MGYGFHTPENYTHKFIGKGPLVQAEPWACGTWSTGLEGRSCVGLDLTSAATVPRCHVHSWKSCPTCPYLPSSHTPGSEPDIVLAEMHGTPSPPLCCLLCWFYTERFQEKNSIMWCFWRPRQREWRPVDFREKKLSAVSPSLTSPSDWRAFYALTLGVTPSDEVRTHPGQVLRATVHASSLIIVCIPRVASEGD